MITEYTITGTAWTAISTAGQSGSCWINEDNEGAVNKADVRIYHTDAGTPAADKVDESKRLFTPKGNTDVLILSADSGTDIHYARCKNADDEAVILVDVV